MNTSEKRRPGPGNSSAHTLRTGVSNPNRNSMPALPPRAAMAANTVSSPEETIEGGAPLTERKEKDATATRSGSIKDKDREKERKERREKREKKERERELEAALKEKDERIAYLEKEMGIMEREFHRELDKLSQNESETATFWQAKHSALNQQFLRTDTELRLLRAEVEVREGEREELREGWEVLRRELKERDNEIRGLRGQVRGLKEWVSNSTRTDGQTCDEVFGDGMARLGNGLQNWVIVNFRKAKIKLDELDEATLAEINDLVPMYEDLASTAKVHLLQSIVSRILVEMVFDAYFVGLSSEQTQQFRQMEKMLYSYASSDEAINQWRSSTLALLRRDSTALDESISSLTEAVLTRITRLLDALCGTSPSEARDSGLRVLVNNSIELARLLVVQKAVLRVHMPAVLPHQRVMFEPETMEDLGGEDEEALTEREICCVAFPGVIKHGDENGGHLQFRNIIVKARVLCSPE
ncbi:Hypothetical protein NCS54_01063200 [Fusarium falciforme]|uniref:Hypothetical protein n=1 Tax=Fusarium falciforme TaxID=195108 RepID=UPI002300AAA1|nr:Hypothetical protein NCS54_01063200 [Fusarium falciforme]KAJ4200428.1 hypothetical protein NW767_007492 [Fusarium falciforme]WAO93099.1 Hypothetical protein NCS54_01063200 [Fusarium falciforme]